MLRLGTKNGVQAALRSEAARTLVGLVAEETAAVAAALGIALPYPDAAARVQQAAKQ